MKTFNAILVGALSLAASTAAFRDFYPRDALAEAYAEADLDFDDSFSSSFSKRDLYAREAEADFDDDLGLYISKRDIEEIQRRSYAVGHGDSGMGLFRRWPPSNAPHLPAGSINQANADAAARHAAGQHGHPGVSNHRQWNDPTPPAKPGPGSSSYFPSGGSSGGSRGGRTGGSRRGGSA